MDVIIVSPSLDIHKNVSGISVVVNFIMSNNGSHRYVHFQQGKLDNESGYLHRRVFRVLKTIRPWISCLNANKEAIIHYNFSLDLYAILRDVLFILIAKCKKRKMVLHVHGGYFLFRKRQPFIIRCILNRIFNKTYPVIVLSEKEKAALERNYKIGNIDVLPNCIDLDRQVPPKNYDESPIHILYIGRIIPEKGIAYIIDAAEQLRKSNIDFKLHIAGSFLSNKYSKEEFVRRLQNDVIYEGVVEGDDKSELLKRCHIFLLPSFYEGLPIALLESMNYGLVPIGTNVGSMSDIVENGKNGFFVETYDADAIVSCIKKLDKDRTLLKSIGIAAQQTIYERLNPEEYIRRLNSIYNTL